MKTKMTTPQLGNSINPLPCRLSFLLLALACFALSPASLAQLPSPAPDGGYPNNNTAEGDNALLNLTTGVNNTAIGFSSLGSDTTGNHNTAVGNFALTSNNGENNSALGSIALHVHTSGNSNTAIGASAMFSDQTGDSNTALGVEALAGNISGTTNVAVGVGAMRQNTTGINNISLGWEAGVNLTTGNFNIDIGNRGISGDTGTIRIGDQQSQNSTFLAGINGVDKSSGSPVFIDANGQLGTGSASTTTPGSVVMLPAVNGVAPAAPAGYVFKGFMLLSPKANGGGSGTSYAVYTKS